MKKYIPKQERHPFRDLRVKLEGTPSEVAQYEKEVAAHLEMDKQDDLMDAGMEGLATKTKKKSK